MVFLEFCALVLVLVTLTQIIIPIFIPKHFNFFWLFRKAKETEDETPSEKNTGDNLRDAVKEALWIKKKADKTVEETRKKTKKNLDDAQNLHDKLE